MDKIRSPSVLTSCERKNEAFPCSGHLLPGTKATIRCKIGYERPEGVNSELTCQESGQWNLQAFKCQSICGRVKMHLSSRIFEGSFFLFKFVPFKALS